MNDQLVHIFDNSTCLTKRQLKDYVTGIMGDEECHAAEVHLNSCPFCSDAVDGMMMHKDEAAQLLAELNPDFLKEHFAQQLPQVHLNALAVPVDQPLPARKKKNNVRPFWRSASVAAAVLFCTGVVWYYGYRKDAYRHTEVAQALPEAAHTPPPGNNTAIAQPPRPMPDENERRGAGPSHPVTPVPVVPEQKKEEEKIPAADNPAASRAEKLAAAPASVSARLAADSIAYSFNTAGLQSDGYYNTQSLKFSSTEADDARPSYGNSFQNLNRRQDNATGAQSLNYTTSQPSLARLKPAISSKPATKYDVTTNAAKAEAETVAAVPPKHSSDLNIGGARTEGTAYVVDGIVLKKDSKDEAAARKKKMPAPRTEDPDELYDQGNYRAALAVYGKDMTHSNKGRRHYAIMGAARCYLGMGQKAKAKQLLQSLADEGGAQSRAARKMLRKMDGNTE